MIHIENLSKVYKKHQAFCRHQHPVLDDVSLRIEKGQCVGLIGESGAGKSTLSRILLGLETYNSGKISVEGQPLNRWLKENPGKMSVVFQDYNASMNPRLTVGQTIQEALLLGKADETLESLMAQVGLESHLQGRYPHELSGGQLQRVAIARVLALRARYIILDEAVSSLDISVQAKILALLKKLQTQYELTYLFISHDLQAITYLCDNVAFLHKGQIVEQLPMTDLLSSQNPYVRKFLGAVKVLEVEACSC